MNGAQIPEMPVRESHQRRPPIRNWTIKGIRKDKAFDLVKPLIFWG